MSEPLSKPQKPVLPPPPASGEDAPDPVTVPPLEPPPPSLEAMVHSRRRSSTLRPEKSSWLLLIGLFVLGMLLTLYFQQ